MLKTGVWGRTGESYTCHWGKEEQKSTREWTRSQLFKQGVEIIQKENIIKYPQSKLPGGKIPEKKKVKSFN